MGVALVRNSRKLLMILATCGEVVVVVSGPRVAAVEETRIEMVTEVKSRVV